jgi:hypothetical protein
MMSKPASYLVRSALTLLVLIAALVTTACGTSSTSIATSTGPDPVKCQVSLASPSSIDASGGAAMLSVTTQPECAWSVSSGVNWISVSPASGQGPGNVEVRVTANDGSSTREADIIVNDSRVRVSQRAPCRYALAPDNQILAAGGGGGTVTVTTNGECAWTAATDVSWIRVTSPLSGSGNGNVNFTVSANSGTDRTGSIEVGGQRSVVTQTGVIASSCTYAIFPASQNISATGGAGSPVSVTTQNGCRWTATSNASWITVTSGASGTANGSVGFAVAANSADARTGTVTIAGRPFTVTQAAVATSPVPAPAPTPTPTPPPPPASCEYSISPRDVKVDAAGGTRTINVSTASGCTWTASTADSWITITSAASGTGSGSVTVSIARNGGKKRNGSVTIAGQNFKVEQAED